MSKTNKNSNPFSSIHFLFQGYGLITKKGVRRYVILPILINIIFFTTVIWLTTSQVSELINQFIPDSLAWLSWLIWPIFGLVILVIIFYTFTLIANLIASPFNGYLSEKVSTLLDNPPPDNQLSWQSNIKRALLRELNKWLYYLLLLIPLIILSFIPIINFLAPFAWIVFTAWMFAIEYTDFPADNFGLNAKQHRQWLHQHRLSALAFGGITMLLTAIPIINLTIIPAAVAGATVFWKENQPNLTS